MSQKIRHGHIGFGREAGDRALFRTLDLVNNGF